MQSDVDTQCNCSRIYLHDFRPTSLFSDVISSPGLLLSTMEDLESNSDDTDVVDQEAVDYHPKRALVVQMVLDKRKVAWLLIFLLLMSPAIGTIVEIYSHQADAGVAVSAGMFAVASFLQGLVAWLQG